MNDDLRDIYRQRVLQHSRQPENRRRPSHANREAVGFNPLCGDKVTVYLDQHADTLDDVAFEGTGCAISIASASMMTQALRGRPTADARAAIAAITAMLDGQTVDTPVWLQELRALENVRDYPSRVKCAVLPWRALEGALDQKTESITTE